jgi:hypothetical protein
MGKVVPCLIPYNPLFYLNFFDQDKASFFIKLICVCDVLCVNTSVMAPHKDPD